MKKGLFLLIFLFSLLAESMGQGDRKMLEGSVKDDKGNGISGVVVNDGINFTVTDAKGQWTLFTDTVLCKLISISTPANFMLPQKNGLAKKFYVEVGEAVKGNANFVLQKRKKPTETFSYVAISDPQVRNAYEMNRWKTEAVVDIKNTVKGLAKKNEVVGMTLGDLVFDNMGLYGEYSQSLEDAGMTVFQCIGNHDFNKKFQDLHNSEYGTNDYAEQNYFTTFGPVNYSFNIGKVHVVTIKNINYVGGKKYVESITGEDLAWLRKDLSYIPKGTLVFLNMHAAAWNTVEGEGNIRNAKALAEVLKEYNVHVFCGHTHYYQNIEVTPNLYQHNIGAACGAWWSGEVNRCGSPNGYLIVDVDGINLKWHYKPTHGEIATQMRVYDKGRFLTQKQFVVANIWDWDSKCKVEWYQDGKLMGGMERFCDADEEYAKRFVSRVKACKTDHLFRAKPQGEYKEIKVVFTNRFGEQYTQTIKREVAVIAHRGSASLFPENTIPAMINSLKLGVRNLEMDLQVTKDGKVVVSHDPYLKGFNKQYPIYKNDYAVLAEKNIGMIPDSDYVHRKNIDCHIPLLSELIDSTEQYCLHNAISPVDYTIEIKSTVKRDGILAPEYKAYTDSCLKVLLAKKLGNRLLIHSFDIPTWIYIHDKYPEVRLMYLVNKNANDYESAMEKLGFIPEVISRNYDKVDRTFVEKAHKDGVEVISYIGDETSVVPNLVKIGVDAVMTNRPDLVFKSIK